jgi:hypothetical protein
MCHLFPPHGPYEFLQRSPFGAPFLGIEQYAEKLVELSDMI